MYDSKVIRRRRVALGVFVGLSLALLTIYFGESAGGALHTLQRGAQAVLSPIESGASKALKPFRDAVAWTGDVFGAKGENERLRGEVARLRRELASKQLATRDAEQLGGFRDLIDSEGFPQGTEPLTARVIARSPTIWYSAVRIDKGSKDGVRDNQPVVTGDGLAGKVTEVSGGTATVTLLTSEGSAVSAQVMPDGANGVVRPKIGVPTDLLLEFVQKKREVREGRTVVTSGFTDPGTKLDSLFPRGIPIGKVTRVDASEREIYQTVHIEPFADFRRMDYVQVLTNPRPGGDQAGLPPQ